MRGMNRKLWPLALLVALTACGPSPMPPDAAHQPSDLTADQLIARYQAARGGEQKLQGIQSARMTGTWGRTANSPIPITVMIAPGRYLRQIGRGASLHSVKTVDGSTTWELGPEVGISKPELMVAEDAARFRNLADPQGPLVNAPAKGNKVEVIGKLPWQGSQVYKLKVTFPDKRVNYFYLDAQSFLPVRVVSTLYLPQIGREIDLEHIYQDYRDINGVKWPFTEKANAPQGRVAQVTTWKKIEVNPPLDESAFKMPTV
jgi:hypothetical protein